MGPGSAERGGQLADQRDDRGRPTLFQLLHQRAADDHPVRDVLQVPDVVRPADPEPDAQGQVASPKYIVS